MVYDFGVRLRQAREKRHLTQEAVGKRLEVSGSNVGFYESNTVVPPADKLKKMCLLYGVTADYLLGLDDRRMLEIERLTEKQAENLQLFLESLGE